MIEPHFLEFFCKFISLADATWLAMSERDRNDDADHGNASPLQGQVLRRNRGREAVLFLRNESLWVADFVDGKGELIDAVTWMRFNCGTASSVQAQRRMVFESALPLDDELAARVEALQAARPPEGGGD